MNNGLLQPKTIIELNDNNARKRYNPDIAYYDVMHGERKVAEINIRGEAAILDEKFIPYDLYLENDRDFDTLINNIDVYKRQVQTLAWQWERWDLMQRSRRLMWY